MLKRQIQYMRGLIFDEDDTKIIQVEKLCEEMEKEEGIHIAVETTRDSGQLIRKIANFEMYDFICMGMELGKEDSIGLAHIVRQLDREVFIIFISDNDERIKEIFELAPATFLDIPLDEAEFRRWIHKIIKRFSDPRSYLSFDFNKRTFHIPYRDILYMESRNHCVRVRTANQWYCFRGRLDEVEKDMETIQSMFIRIHKSYLVNYKYLSRIDGKGVEMRDGTNLPISASYRKQSKKKYLEYMETEKNIVHGSA